MKIVYIFPTGETKNQQQHGELGYNFLAELCLRGERRMELRGVKFSVVSLANKVGEVNRIIFGNKTLEYCVVYGCQVDIGMRGFSFRE